MSIRNYGLITSLDELNEYIERIHDNVFAFDIETGYHGPDREKGAVHPETAILAGISFTASTDWARYVPLGHDNGENLDNKLVAAIFWDLLQTGLGVAHNCFAGETTFLTRDGLRRLRDCAGQGLVEVWTATGWASAEVKSFGKAPVRDVVLVPYNRSRSNTRRTYQATDNHRWQVERIGWRHRERVWVPVPGLVRTDELRPGDKLRALAPDLKPDTYSDAFRHGLIFADGSLTSGRRTSSGRWIHQLRLCGWKSVYSDRFPKVSYPLSAHGDPVISSYHSDINLKELPPGDSSPQYLADFIAGWAALDGTEVSSRPDRTRIVCTAKERDVAWLEEHAAQAGWWVTGSNRAWCTGFSGGAWSYSVTLSHHHDMAWTVKSVSPPSQEEREVYCAVVPGVERFTLGCGVETANCTFELQHLAKWFRAHLTDDPVRGAAVRSSDGYFPVRSDTLVEAYLKADFERFGLKPLTALMFDRTGRPVEQSRYLARMDQLAEINRIKDPEERKQQLAQFDGHLMTELYELFPGLEVGKRKYLRFNVLDLTPQVIEYACEDSVWCLAIHRQYHPQVKDRLLYKVEMAIVQHVLHGMEDEGIVYDWALMRRTADELRAFRDKFNAEIMAELTAMVGQPVAVNLASPPQIADILYTKLGYRTSVYTDKTRDLPPEQRKMSTGKIALERLAQQYPVVQKIRQWKQITRLLGTYLDQYEKKFNYADDGRAHPNHLSCFVITGRFAHADPPYAGSPKKYHYDSAAGRAAHAAGEEPPPGTCFKFNFRDVIMAPPEHYILGFDLSQAELRAIAGEAQETALLEAFANGDDVHRVTASLMLGIPLDQVTEDQRAVGKMLNFALLYGMSTKGLADRLGIPIEEAQSLMDKYFAGLPNIAAYMAKQVQHGQTYGYVMSKFGRKLPIWEYRSEKRWIYQKGDRACVNYPIQGAATGDYMKMAMVRAVSAIKSAGLEDKMKLVMNIHDALEFYVHRDVNPQDAINVLRPAVVFPIPGWPEMKADWHIAKRWGSPTEITFDADGTMIVKGEAVEELLAPGLEEDEDGDVVEILPEVDPEVLHEAAKPDSGRQVVITLNALPEGASWRQFMDLARQSPGINTVQVVTPQGAVTLPFTCSIRPDHLGMIARVLGHSVLSVEYLVDAVERLADDVLF